MKKFLHLNLNRQRSLSVSRDNNKIDILYPTPDPEEL